MFLRYSVRYFFRLNAIAISDTGNIIILWA